MKISAFLIILFASASVFGQMNPAQTDVDNMCNVSAYIADKDPKGVNVRSKSDGKSKIVGVIPFNADGTVVDIIGAKGDWVKIENARTADSDGVFTKTGWIYAPLLAVSTMKQGAETEKVNAYKTPYMETEVVAKLPVFQEYKLAGCHDAFVKITIPQGKTSIFGWLAMENTCDLPWTNCS